MSLISELDVLDLMCQRECSPLLMYKGMKFKHAKNLVFDNLVDIFSNIVFSRSCKRSCIVQKLYCSDTVDRVEFKINDRDSGSAGLSLTYIRPFWSPAPLRKFSGSTTVLVVLIVFLMNLVIQRGRRKRESRVYLRDWR